VSDTVPPYRPLPSDLPPSALDRLAKIQSSGIWGPLPSDEFAAIRVTGFEPVGQVYGSAVYDIDYSGGPGCAAEGIRYARGPYQPRAYAAASRQGLYSSFGPLVDTLCKARRKAIGRMAKECALLGGHGVVAVRLTTGRYPVGEVKFEATGIAVRAPAAPPLRQPFTSDLSGQEFAKLVMRGWMAAGLVLGISIEARHDNWTTNAQTRWRAGNTEVDGYTKLFNGTRACARTELAKDAQRLGAEGIVIADMEMRVWERECEDIIRGRDHVVEATMVGTAIVRFSRSAEGPVPAAVPIMSLDPQRRHAPRTRAAAT